MARCQGSTLCFTFFHIEEPSPLETLGILSFDAVKTMCRLVSLYKSLTDVEIHKLRRHVIKSRGVANLNSPDECFLLNLACAERLEDLNLAAAAVSRLGSRCSSKSLIHFDAVYADMKNGGVDLKKLEFGTKNVEKVIEKMEKLVSATRNLLNSMESLSEMEVSEKKMQRWRTMRVNNGLKVKVECFNDRIIFHKRQVQYYKQISLWNLTFDKVAGMEHSELYKINISIFDKEEESLKKKNKNDGYVLKCNKVGVIHFHSHSHSLVPAVDTFGNGKVAATNNIVFRLAPGTTVGGVGLSQRYANVILFTERIVHAAAAIGEDARKLLYEMLPEGLQIKLRGKLREKWLKWEEGVDSLVGEEEEGKSKAMERWRDAAEEVMEWLAPLAHDTLKWQAERNLEKLKFETKPTVLLLQTLHYSNLEKVDEAIVDVLVGMSCIYWCQKQW
ncbi:protein PSK SIMULATOR 1-like [Vicia villosa]|uniref:protein PSK SIMULATOR 1-like n=1 Tax=Vicia villosa TaxID=3911 RepID=UPI00273CB84F|nr:protein PSK SIMULATOR 1-like [Vicia villosa]